MKRSRVIVIGIICILTAALFSHFKENNDYVKPITISRGRIKALEKYKLKISENTTRETIENLCEIESTEYIGGKEYTIWTSNQLSDYLYNFSDFIGIDGTEYCIYIAYVTIDNMKVYLGYNEQGFVSIDVLDQVKNTLISVRDGEGVLYRDFL